MRTYICVYTPSPDIQPDETCFESSGVQYIFEIFFVADLYLLEIITSIFVLLKFYNYRSADIANLKNNSIRVEVGIPTLSKFYKVTYMCNLRHLPSIKDCPRITNYENARYDLVNVLCNM